MQNTVLTRMGDGERISMPVDEVKEELLLGTQDAAQKGEISELTQQDLDQMFEILAESGRIVSVPPGDEVVVTDDGCAGVFCGSSADGGAGLPVSRQNSILAYERGLAADTVSLGHGDYSFKPVKPIIDYEAQTYYTTSLATTVPFFYGAQPNLGLYFRKDGPQNSETTIDDDGPSAPVPSTARDPIEA